MARGLEAKFVTYPVNCVKAATTTQSRSRIRPRHNAALYMSTATPETIEDLTSQLAQKEIS